MRRPMVGCPRVSGNAARGTVQEPSDTSSLRGIRSLESTAQRNVRAKVPIDDTAQFASESNSSNSSRSLRQSQTAYLDLSTPLESLSDLSDTSDSGGEALAVGEDDDDEWMNNCEGVLQLQAELCELAKERIETWRGKSAGRQRDEVCSGKRRLAKKNVRAACVSGTVRLEVFELRKAVETLESKAKRGRGEGTTNEETIERIFDGTIPRRAVSKDNFDVVWHFPNAIGPLGTEHVAKGCQDWGAKAKLNQKVANDTRAMYKTDTPLWGTTRFASLWHPIGHPHDNPVTASDILRTGETWEAACTCMSELQGLSAFVTKALELIDPEQHRLLTKVHQFRLKGFKSQIALAALDRSLIHEGREIVFNRCSPPHRDTPDPHWAWACIFYFGDFDGAYLEFPELKLKVRLRPGDMVFLRGRDLRHRAQMWAGGNRHFVVHFTHKAMWDRAGEVCTTSPSKVWAEVLTS